MFSIFKKTETHEISGKELLTHLQTLQRTEDEIHQFNKYDDKAQVKSKAEEREKISRDLANEFRQLEEDINSRTNNGGVEDKSHFDKIKKHLIQIEQILKQQLDELNKEKVLEDSMQRTIAINGNLEKGSDSQLTIQLKQLSDLLNSQEGLVGRYIVDIGKEIEQLPAQFQRSYIYEYKEFDNFATGLNRVKNNPDYILDMKEILKARIEDPKLFKIWLISGYGILYKGGGSTEFKVVKNIKDPNINKLLSLRDGFNENYLEEPYYDSVKVPNDCILDAKKMIRRPRLTENDFLNHPFWRCIFDNDKYLMKDYFKAYSSYSKESEGLYVNLINGDTSSQWRSLSVNNGSNYSYLSTNLNLSFYGRFLFRMPKQ